VANCFAEILLHQFVNRYASRSRAHITAYKERRCNTASRGRWGRDETRDVTRGRVKGQHRSGDT
ncbi:Hypothetical predicted protein, partial [Marmota monax]